MFRSRTTPGRAVAHLIGGPHDGKVHALPDNMVGRELLVPILTRDNGSWGTYDPYSSYASSASIDYRTGRYEPLAQSRVNPNVLVYEWVG